MARTTIQNHGLSIDAGTRDHGALGVVVRRAMLLVFGSHHHRDANYLVANPGVGQKIRLETARDRRQPLAELLADRRVGAVPRARWPRRGVRGSTRGRARRRA